MSIVKHFFSNFKKDWRIFIVFAGFFVFSLAAVSRFYDLQIAQGQKFEARASQQVDLKQQSWQKMRGKIYFQTNSEMLMPAAINKDFWRVFAVPEEIKDPSAVAQTLSPILNLEEKELEEKFSKEKDLFELLAKKIDDDLAQMIKSLNLPGIYIDKETRRFYPNGDLASHVIGFVRDDDQNFSGQYGLEKYYNDYLSQDSGGGFLKLVSLKNAILGRKNYDLVSAIDFNIQKKSEELLGKMIAKQDASGGAVIVLEPKTGRVLAMAGRPDFDPNNYFDFPLSSFPNPNIEFIYEPGSIFKVLTAAAGLESKKITPQTVYKDEGYVKIDGRTIRNWDLKVHGVQSVYDILAKSLNTGVVFIESVLGHDLFYQFIRQANIEEKTGIDLPGEVEGNISNLKGFQDIYFATASFGQGISVTPIGILSALSAVANKGVAMRPYLVEKMIDSITEEEKITQPKEMGKIMSEETARQLRIMLVNSVEENYLAKIAGYNVAGKTGTAQVPDANGRYSEIDTIHSFVGFTPAENPRFIILVKIDKPQKDKLAGATAIPVFKQLAEYILQYYMIPPDK